MNFSLYVHAIPRILLTLLVGTLYLSAHASEPSDEQTAALKSYYLTCNADLQSADVPKMCDTLAMRARAANNSHYIALAALTKLDYYYFQNDKDKTLENVAEAKRICRQYDEKGYYYFVWGSRLIMFYLKNGMTNHALLEAQNMLREAQADDFQQGMIECYKAMGNIYTIQSNPQLAAENYRKAVDLAEKYDPEDVNIPIYYSSLADNELRSKRPEEAEKALDKVEAYFAKADTVTPYQRLSLARGRINVGIDKGDIESAREAYEQIESLFARYNGLAIHTTGLLEARMNYFKASKQYDKAVAIIDSLFNANPTSEMLTFLLSRKADICWERNDRAAAAEYYRNYLHLTDSVRRASAQNSANEIAGLLNLQQLEKEKQQLLVDIQHRRLKTTYWALGLLGLVMLAGAIVLIRLFQMNRQLKEAKQRVLRQNKELETAKLKAEEASLMKSRFIQDISHEVRTPLNAIVGFSHVVGELCNQPETREYASIIETNSDDLLRLFNDVLELSNLDEINRLNYNIPADINASCRAALDEVRPLVKEGVELKYNAPEESLQILSNPTYVTRILNSILHNAAKFTESGSITLACALSRDAGTILYSVTDTGPGIPTEMQEMIFERFKKVNTFTQGSGLGLAVCRTIATKLGGTLELDKSYTHGCRFLFTLPLKTSEEQAA